MIHALRERPASERCRRSREWGSRRSQAPRAAGWEGPRPTAGSGTQGHYRKSCHLASEAYPLGRSRRPVLSVTHLLIRHEGGRCLQLEVADPSPAGPLGVLGRRPGVSCPPRKAGPARSLGREPSSPTTMQGEPFLSQPGVRRGPAAAGSQGAGSPARRLLGPLPPPTSPDIPSCLCPLSPGGRPSPTPDLGGVSVLPSALQQPWLLAPGNAKPGAAPTAQAHPCSLLASPLLCFLGGCVSLTRVPPVRFSSVPRLCSLRICWPFSQTGRAALEGRGWLAEWHRP